MIGLGRRHLCSAQAVGLGFFCWLLSAAAGIPSARGESAPKAPTVEAPQSRMSQGGANTGPEPAPKPEEKAPPLNAIPPPPSAASASTAPTLAPPQASSAPQPERAKASADVRLGDELLLSLHAPLGSRSAEERASFANDALKSVLAEGSAQGVRIERQRDRALVKVNGHLIVELSEADAAAAGASSLAEFSASVEAKLSALVQAEKRRSAITKTAFSVALAIFLGLLCLYLVRRLRAASDQMKEWLHDNPDRVPGFRVFTFEVLGSGPVRSGLFLAVGLGKWIAQLGLVYAYLVLVLSLFESTRGLTARLTGFVTVPLAALTSRLAQTLPVLLIAAIAAAAVFLLVRFVGLFFASVARGEAELVWIPQDFALPLSLILRTTIVLIALIFGGPVLTGDSEGALSRTGLLALMGVGLASVPILATGAVGMVTIFSRRLRIGDTVEVAGSIGRIQEVGVLDLRLRDRDGAEVRVPHLLGLIRSTRILKTPAATALEVHIRRSTERVALEMLLVEVSQRIDGAASVQLLGVEPQILRYRLTLPGRCVPTEALALVTGALEQAKIEIDRLVLL